MSKLISVKPLLGVVPDDGDVAAGDAADDHVLANARRPRAAAAVDRIACVCH